MTDERTDPPDQLTQEDLEDAISEPSSDPEGMPMTTPHVTKPGITRPVEPSD
jgi:hypothetical protein